MACSGRHLGCLQHCGHARQLWLPCKPSAHTRSSVHPATSFPVTVVTQASLSSYQALLQQSARADLRRPRAPCFARHGRAALRVHSATTELAAADNPVVTGKLESTKLRSDVRQRVQDAIEALRYEVTVGDVAARAGISLAEAEEALTALAADSLGTLKVSDSGDIVYSFSNDFKNAILSRSLFLRLQPGLKAASQALALGTRMAFGAALVSSVALVYFSIFVLMNSDSEGKSESRRRSSSMGTYMFMDTLDLLFYPRTTYYQVHRGRITQHQDRMGFLEAVFSFVLGDGNPNTAYDEQRWQMVGNYIKSRGGVVAAEELAPFLDHPKGYSTSDPDSNDESYIVPALVRFGGSPEVDDQGNLLYHFPSLQVSGQAPATRALPAQPALERLWQLTKADSGQKVGVGLLGAVNLIGVAILQGMLNSRAMAMAIQRGTEVGAYALWVSRFMPFLQLYAASFFVVPALRWALNQARNRRIEARNDARVAAQQTLRAPDAALQRKLDTARRAARQRRITDSDVIYRSDRNQSEQARDLEAEDFDRRLSQAGQARGGGAGQGDALSRVRQLFRDSQSQQA